MLDMGVLSFITIFDSYFHYATPVNPPNIIRTERSNKEKGTELGAGMNRDNFHFGSKFTSQHSLVMKSSDP